MATNNQKLDEVSDSLQKIHLSADLKGKELSDLEVRSSKLANDIIQLQESIKEQRAIERTLDANLLAEERKTVALEAETIQLENIEDMKTHHTDNLNKIFKDIQMKQKKRREEYQQLMETMINRARMNPTTYKSIDVIKQNVEQIKSEYFSVEEQLKDVQNELKTLKTNFMDPNIENEIENINDFMDSTYEEYMNPEPMNNLLDEIKQLTAEAEKCEKYVQELQNTDTN